MPAYFSLHTDELIWRQVLVTKGNHKFGQNVVVQAFKQVVVLQQSNSLLVRMRLDLRMQTGRQVLQDVLFPACR